MYPMHVLQRPVQYRTGPLHRRPPVWLAQPMTEGTPPEHYEIPPQEGDPAQDPTVAGEATVPGAAADRLRLESALLEAQEEIRDRRLAMEVIRNELARARQDLDAERERHKDDAERFRANLAHLRASADDAVADEQRATSELTERLDDAEGTIAQLREQLESSHASLAVAQSEIEDLRAELRQAREEFAADGEALTRARDAAAEARADTERLLERLRTLAEGLG
jgi:chromosome segregation ATPase